MYLVAASIILRPSNKIDELNAGFGQKIDQLTAQHEKEIAAVLEKLDEVTAQLVKLSEQAEKNVGVLDDRLGSIGSKFDAFVSKFDELNKGKSTWLRSIQLFKTVASRGGGALDKLIDVVVGGGGKGGKTAGVLQKAQSNLKKTAGQLTNNSSKTSPLSVLA